MHAFQTRKNIFYFLAVLISLCGFCFRLFRGSLKIDNNLTRKNLSSERKGQYYLHGPSCIVKSSQTLQFCKLLSTSRMKKACQGQKAKEKRTLKLVQSYPSSFQGHYKTNIYEVVEMNFNNFEFLSHFPTIQLNTTNNFVP